MSVFTRKDVESHLDSAGCLTVPEKITEIESGTCEGNLAITKALLPNSLITIGSGAFSMCEKLKEVDLPDGLTNMGEYAFSSCAISLIRIPGSLEVIPPRAFYACSALQSVEIAEGVTKISSQAFADCARKLKVDIPSTVTSIAEDAFDIEQTSPKPLEPVFICARTGTYAYQWALDHPDVACVW